MRPRQPTHQNHAGNRYRLSELVDTKEVQRLAELLYDATGIPVGILDPDGTILVGAGWQDICTKFHRVHPVTLERCRESDAYIQSHLDTTDGYISYKCKNGLWDLAMPITIDGQHLGTLFLGQFIYEGEEVDVEFFRRQGREFDFDEEAYLAALRRLPILPKARVDQIMEYNAGFVRMLAQQGLVRLRQIETANALRENEESLRTTLNAIGDAVVATDVSGHIVRMNPVAERLTGVTSLAAVGRTFSNVLRVADAESGAEVGYLVDSVLRTGALVAQQDWLVTNKTTGDRRRVAGRGNPLLDREGRCVGAVLVFRDVTDERALHAQLAHSQKMDALGQLAGGVAHDFNNLLAGIQGSAELLEPLLADRTEAREFVERIIRASERAASLTGQLLAFSRKDKLSKKNVDVHASIREVVGLLSRSIDRNIDIRLTLDATRPVVFGDVTGLQNALLNLALNARDAMPRGGVLSFETRDARFDAPRLLDTGGELPEGDYVEVSVSDTGVGMPPEVLSRIFEPFYTTKASGEGTGLGLASVYGCVQSHHAGIEVQSTPRVGSTFRVWLPSVGERVPETAPVGADAKASAGRGKLALVVDDEEVVRNVTAAALRRLGYTVTTCADGVEAVLYFREHHADVAFVVLDLIMPRAGGAETFHELKAIAPDVKVLLSSGFGHEEVLTQLRRDGVRAILHKPFRLKELAAAIEAL